MGTRAHSKWIAALGVVLALTSSSASASGPEPTPPASSPDASLPTADAPKPGLEPAPAPVNPRANIPESGTGLITVGSFALAGGVGLYVVGSVFAAVRNSEWGYFFLGGTPLLAGGSLMIWGGTKRLKTYRAWSDETGITPPPGGRPLLISGLILTGGGLISSIAYGGLSLAYCPSGCGPSNEWVWLGPNVAAIVAGVGMTIAGGVLRHRYRRWEQQGLASRLQMLPTVSPLPGGVQAGVVGRF